jgi:transcriptional regulator with XRE-family HTH domain
MRRSERPQAAFGETVRELRTRCNATQEEIADDAGITPQTLSLIERGQANPTWDTARKLATALGVSIGELAKLSEKHE